VPMQQILGGRRKCNLATSYCFHDVKLDCGAGIVLRPDAADDVSTGVLSRFRYPKPSD
jgi:hypothetical protein